MQTLTPQQVDVLRRIPLHRGGEPADPEIIGQLVGLGLVEERAGTVSLTQRGAVVKVLRRSLRQSN